VNVGGVWLTVLDVRGDQVKLGFDAAPGVPIDREEIFFSKQSADGSQPPALKMPLVTADGRLPTVLVWPNP
jgi:sRNA-binding carbon storage regulator CsrA